MIPLEVYKRTMPPESFAALTAPTRGTQPSHTITVHNEAGEVVTEPQEQARRLQAEFGGKWVVVYGGDGEPTGVALPASLDQPTDPELLAAFARMNAETDAVRAAGLDPHGWGVYDKDGKRVVEHTWVTARPKG